MGGRAVPYCIVGKDLGRVRRLRMGGLIQVIQEIVDGLGLPSDIGNQGTSVNKRLDPRPFYNLISPGPLLIQMR